MSARLSPIGLSPVVCRVGMPRPIHVALAGELVRSCDGAGCKAAAGASSGRHPTKRSRSGFSRFPTRLIDLGAAPARSASFAAPGLSLPDRSPAPVPVAAACGAGMGGFAVVPSVPAAVSVPRACGPP